MRDGAAKCANVLGRTIPDDSPSLDTTGVTEPALDEAVRLASQAGRWDVVALLAGVLAARQARAAEPAAVVDLDARRRGGVT